MLDDLGSGGVAADDGGLRRHGEPPLAQKSGKVDSRFGGVVLEYGCVTQMHLGAVIYPSCDLNWLVGPVHFIKNVVQDVPGVGD